MRRVAVIGPERAAAAPPADERAVLAYPAQAPVPPDLHGTHLRIVACEACPRLRTYCRGIAETRRAAFRHDTYWARPVPGFGDAAARLLILGLAPAAHGANRTGRVFTGDGRNGSGDFLMRGLMAGGFANQGTSDRPDDGLTLTDAYIAAAVRCAPPDNKPTPDEVDRCLSHLDAELAALRRVQLVVVLGRIAYDAYRRLLARNGRRLPAAPFAHGHYVDASHLGAPSVLQSYHPSRQNTHTGRLTDDMLAAVFRDARRRLDGATVDAAVAAGPGLGSHAGERVGPNAGQGDAPGSGVGVSRSLGVGVSRSLGVGVGRNLGVGVGLGRRSRRR